MDDVVAGSPGGSKEWNAQATPSNRLRRLVEVGIAVSSELERIELDEGTTRPTRRVAVFHGARPAHG